MRFPAKEQGGQSAEMRLVTHEGNRNGAIERAEAGSDLVGLVLAEETWHLDQRNIHHQSGVKALGRFARTREGAMPNLRWLKIPIGAEKRREPPHFIAASLTQRADGIFLFGNGVSVTNKVNRHSFSSTGFSYGGQLAPIFSVKKSAGSSKQSTQGKRLGEHDLGVWGKER